MADGARRAEALGAAFRARVMRLEDPREVVREIARLERGPELALAA
jgi:hypothetical protein